MTFAIRYAKPSDELASVFGGAVLRDKFSFAVVAPSAITADSVGVLVGKILHEFK